MQQQQMNQGQMTMMPQPPNMVSGKDQQYITDMLSWNLNACKKAYFYAQHCQNSEIKAAIDQAGQMHQRHYEQILQHLNQNPNPTMS
ncbi:hypothetical protein RZN22_09530 [Bacillaceae bacterium S4-13-58]